MRTSDQSEPEQALESCRAIQYFWDKVRQTNPTQSELLKRDYLAKARGLNRADLADLDRVALNYIVPDLRFDPTTAGSMPQFDVGILTVQPNEWHAVRQVFDLEDKLIGYGPEGQHYYATELPCGARKARIRAVFAVVGESLNVQAGLATQDLLSRFSIDAVFLVGMAIGRETMTSRDDVVIPQKVIYYEPGTLSEDGARSRQYDRDIPQSMLHMLANFKVDKAWYDELASQYVRADVNLMPKGYTGDPPITIHQKKIIASGEKIIENVFLDELAGTKDDRLIAGDQEAWGFALASKNHPWMVFRGIADHGRGRDTSHQFTSTVAAASALRHFIATCYVPSAEFASH